MGAFDAPDVGSGPVGFRLLSHSPTNADKTLSGNHRYPWQRTRISYVGRSLHRHHRTGTRTITLQPNMAEGVSQSSGAGFELFGTDSVGTRVWVNAMATNPDGSIAAVGEEQPISDSTTGTVNDGTNNAYTAFYGISGGPCDGLGGGDAPFLLINKDKKVSKRPRWAT